DRLGSPSRPHQDRAVWTVRFRCGAVDCRLTDSGEIVVVPSQYVLERLREDDEFILSRGRAGGADPRSVLLLEPVSAHPTLETLNKLTYEYSLRSELESAWAVRPLALSRHGGQQMLLLEDPGGELLSRLVHELIELRRFLEIAIGLTNAVGALHRHQ